MDTGAFKQAMAQWASGVSIITTVINGEYHGMTASSFSSLSLNPMLVMFNVGKNQTTHDLLLQTGVFAINILRSTQTDLGKSFAGMVPGVTDRFAGLPLTTAVTGAPILPDVLAWVDCRTHLTCDGGDHTIFVGEVLGGAAAGDAAPLLYFNRHWGTFSAPSLAASEPPRHGLTHIVMFRLHDPSADNLARLRDALLALKGQIPQIQRLEVGTNVIKSERAYDLAITVTFESLEALEMYQKHPAHVQVLQDVIRPLASSIVAVDYES